MRRLGDELGIKAPSLYKHLPGRDAVVTGVGGRDAVRDRRATARGRIRALTPATVRSPPCSPPTGDFGRDHPNLYRLVTPATCPGPRSPRARGLGRRAVLSRHRRAVPRAGAVGVRPRHPDPRDRRALPARLRSRSDLGGRSKGLHIETGAFRGAKAIHGRSATIGPDLVFGRHLPLWPAVTTALLRVRRNQASPEGTLWRRRSAWLVRRHYAAICVMLRWLHLRRACSVGGSCR